MDEFEVGKRRKRVITYSSVAASCFVLMLVVVFASGYDNLGYGSANNMVVTWLMIISLVLTLMALISGCRVRTPKGGITHWKRVGLFALIVWGAVIAQFAAAALSQFAPPLAPILGVIGGAYLAFIPSLVWFPIWTGVNAIRGAQHPELLAQLRSGGATATIKEPSPSSGGLATPVLGLSESETARESQDVSPAQVGNQAIVSASVDVMAKRTGRKGWLLATLVFGLLFALIVWGYVGDQYVRSQEMSAILDQVERSVSQQNSWETRAYSNMDNFFTSSGGTDDAPNGAVAKISDASEDLAVELSVIRRSLDEVSVFAWHGANLRLRDDYQARMDALIDWLTGMADAEGGEAMMTAIRRNDVANSTTSKFATQSARSALPALFGDDLAARVNHLFPD